MSSNAQAPSPVEQLFARADVLASTSDLIVVTGAAGFIGGKVVDKLIEYGFRRLRCLVRPTSNVSSLTRHRERAGVDLDILEGDLLSPVICERLVDGAAVVYHLAAGVDKAFPVAFLNSAVATRNLLHAVSKQPGVKRFVNVSSFAVYSNKGTRRGSLLTEESPTERDATSRGDAYTYGKIKQEELVFEFSRSTNLSISTIRPGAVIGPGRAAISGRVGIDTFGLYFHLGGSNKMPFTYVDNCADAIARAGVLGAAGGQIFNVVDDDLPTSRRFLKLYKAEVGKFRSIAIPYFATYFLCYSWEKYVVWSRGQLPPVFNRRRAEAEWKGNTFSNRKLKEMLGWRPWIPMDQAIAQYLSFQKGASSKSC
jgi:nucleoside-diphosphate-sugar epimerase